MHVNLICLNCCFLWRNREHIHILWNNRLTNWLPTAHPEFDVFKFQWTDSHVQGIFFFLMGKTTLYLDEEKYITSWITSDSIMDGFFSIQVTKESIPLAYFAKIWASLFPRRCTCRTWNDLNSCNKDPDVDNKVQERPNPREHERWCMNHLQR